MEFNQVVIAGAAGLEQMEFWCITHPDGDLIETASKDLTLPVRIFCEALGVDWSDANEQGYSLGKVVLTDKQLAEMPTDRLLGSLSEIMKTN